MRCLATARRYSAIVLVSVIGMVLSGSVFLLVRHWEDEQFEASLTDSVDEHVSAIRDDVDGTLEVPTYLRPFFAATLFELRADVQAFLAEILGEEDEVEVLGWAPHIQEQERDTAEAWGQGAVDPGFRVIEATPQGSMSRPWGALSIFRSCTSRHRGRLRCHMVWIWPPTRRFGRPCSRRTPAASHASPSAAISFPMMQRSPASSWCNRSTAPPRSPFPSPRRQPSQGSSWSAYGSIS